MALNASQRRFLIWIRDNEHHRSAWLNEDGKSPTKKRPNLAIMELSGPGGSVRIMDPDQVGITSMIEPAPFKQTGRIYKLSALGIAALAADEQDTTP